MLQAIKKFIKNIRIIVLLFYYKHVILNKFLKTCDYIKCKEWNNKSQSSRKWKDSGATVKAGNSFSIERFKF